MCWTTAAARLRLRDELDSVLLEVTYGDETAWPVAADGAGHSLVLARPSYGEGRSARLGGQRAPRAARRARNDADSPVPAASVLINEILAHTDPPQEDYIELYNYSASAVDLGGCVLTDDPATNRFRIPAGTTIPARGFLAFTQTATWLRVERRRRDDLFHRRRRHPGDGRARASATRRTASLSGAFPDGAPDFRRLSSVTPGATNARPLLSDVVINEILYNPADRRMTADEFVEIYNRGTSRWTWASGG